MMDIGKCFTSSKKVILVKIKRMLQIQRKLNKHCLVAVTTVVITITIMFLRNVSTLQSGGMFCFTA